MQIDLLSYVAAQSDKPTETTSTPTVTGPIKTMADVVAWCEAEGRDRYAKALKRMGRAAFNIDLGRNTTSSRGPTPRGTGARPRRHSCPKSPSLRLRRLREPPRRDGGK